VDVDDDEAEDDDSDDPEDDVDGLSDFGAVVDDAADEPVRESVR
jgi:hypothetical protein